MELTLDWILASNWTCPLMWGLKKGKHRKREREREDVRKNKAKWQ